MEKDLELYIHVPFCVRKCHYCDFLSFAGDEETIDDYVEALVKEIAGASVTYRDRQVISVFIGGGTPTVLSEKQISDIMKAVFENYDIVENAEITIESNPGTLGFDKLRVMRACGINRLSIGLQSADNRELKILGRIHTYEEFEDNFFNARSAGFDNINVDIISSLPGQTWEDFEKTLEKVISLNPEHISAYSLIVEEGTPLYEIYGDDKCNIDSKVAGLYKDKAGAILSLPSEDDDRLIYHNTKKYLEENGYRQYEISNYAREGYECRHNSGYWTRTDYLGLGLGASSLINNSRWKNTSELETYMLISRNVCTGKQLIQDYEWLSKDDCISETMFLGLRLNQGIDTEKFTSTYGISMFTRYRDWLNKMTTEELLIEENGHVKLTDKGRDLANYVMSGFV